MKKNRVNKMNFNPFLKNNYSIDYISFFSLICFFSLFGILDIENGLAIKILLGIYIITSTPSLLSVGLSKEFFGFLGGAVLFVIPPGVYAFWGSISILKSIFIIHVFIFLRQFCFQHLLSEGKKKSAEKKISLICILIILTGYIVDGFNFPMINGWHYIAIIPASIFVTLALIYRKQSIFPVLLFSILYALSTNSRTEVLIVLLIALYFLFPGSIREYAVPLFFLIPYLIIASAMLTNIFFDIQKFSTYRSVIWGHWVSILSQHPNIFFWGYGDNSGYALMHSFNNKELLFRDFSQPHNIVLGEVLRMGAVSFLVFTFIFFKKIIAIRRNIGLTIIPIMLYIAINMSVGGAVNLLSINPTNIILFVLYMYIDHIYILNKASNRQIAEKP